MLEGVMDMTVGQLVGGLAGIVTLLSVFIEITPIKVKPVSAFLSWVGKKTSGDVIARIDKLESRMQDLSDGVEKVEYSMDRRNAVTCRVRILRFGDECRIHMKHSKEMFDQALEDIDTYEKYCDAHPEFLNNKTVLTIQLIKDAYQKCVENNDFL